MVEAQSPHWSQRFACSDACRAGAIAQGPFPVLLPPDGPSDLPGQLVLDAWVLRRYVDDQGDAPFEPGPDDPRDWLGLPLGRVAADATRILVQLDPIRSRRALLASYQREYHHSPALRLAYATCWLALARTTAFGLIAHRRGRRTSGSRAR